MRTTTILHSASGHPSTNACRTYAKGHTWLFSPSSASGPSSCSRSCPLSASRQERPASRRRLAHPSTYPAQPSPTHTSARPSPPSLCTVRAALCGICSSRSALRTLVCASPAPHLRATLSPPLGARSSRSAAAHRFPPPQSNRAPRRTRPVFAQQFEHPQRRAAFAVVEHQLVYAPRARPSVRSANPPARHPPAARSCTVSAPLPHESERVKGLG